MTEAASAFPTSLSSLRESITNRSRSKRALLLMAPIIAFELVIFVVPFLILLRISLAEGATDLAYVEGSWSLGAYAEVLSSGLVRSIVGYSFVVGLTVTAITIAIALFYAYAIWRTSGLVKSALLFSVVLPLLTTLVIRTYAFRPLLAPSGTFNEILLSLNLVSSPIQIVPHTVGVVIGQTYIVLPYAVLAIYSVMATMDWHVVEAARDLGASRPRSVLEVVVPQVMPGVIVAAVISFAWSAGAYAAPDLLSNNITFAMHVEGLLLSDLRYPFAAALSIVMLVLMAGCLAALVGVLDRFGGAFERA